MARTAELRNSRLAVRRERRRVEYGRKKKGKVDVCAGEETGSEEVKKRKSEEEEEQSGELRAERCELDK